MRQLIFFCSNQAPVQMNMHTAAISTITGKYEGARVQWRLFNARGNGAGKSASKFERVTAVGDADERGSGIWQEGAGTRSTWQYVLEGGNGSVFVQPVCRLFSCTFSTALSRLSVPVCALLDGQKATDEKRLWQMPLDEKRMIVMMNFAH